MIRVLHVCAEAHPIVKTGGLADVTGSLPAALSAHGADVRIVLPAYPAAIDRVGPLETVAKLQLPGSSRPVRILRGEFPGTGLPLYLVDSTPHFTRPGNPYGDPWSGHDWPDNAERFCLFARAAVELALGRVDRSWRADVVHAHDWHTGLVPALLSLEPRRPASVFTVHNLAYQGLFAHETFTRLGLPPALWSMEGLEFHGQLAFIKGGLAYADRVTVVSPTYAREVQTADYGNGLEGLLHHRRDRLVGIVNGIDTQAWNPVRDPALTYAYGLHDLDGKTENKAALQRQLGLEVDWTLPVVAFVGRLVTQKGIDLLLAALPRLASHRVQLLVHGQGERRFADALEDAARAFPGKLWVRVGYSEELAHRLLAAADLLLMPSRFEPCGLVQLYAYRYGAVPVVRRTGGLADTVVDATLDTLRRETATGFQFAEPTPEALADAAERALAVWRHPPTWRALVRAGMSLELGWDGPARRYLELYEELAPASVRARAPQRSPAVVAA